MAAGGGHTLALTAGGSLWSWGDGGAGQLGDGNAGLFYFRAAPFPIPNLTGVKSVLCGEAHSFALKQDGSWWGWGWNTSGALGDGSSSSRLTPTALPELEGLTTLAGGFLHSVGAKAGGCLTVRSVLLDDDAAGGTFGNGDEIANPGERIELLVSVKNCGGAAVTGVQGSLRLEGIDRYVRILRSSAAYGTIPAGETSAGLGAFRLALSKVTPIPYTVALQLTLTDNQARTWETRLNFSVNHSLAIQGTVTLDGNPLAGAWVIRGGTLAGIRQTDAAGHYLFGALAGSYTVQAYYPGAVSPDPRALTLPPSPGVADFAFVTGTLSGRVLDLETGQALPFAQVTSSEPWADAVTSDANGLYSIQRLFGKPAWLRVRAEKSGYLASTWAEALLPPSASGVDLRLMNKSWHALAWGGNDLGELGDGTNEMRLTPAGVRGMGAGIQTAAAGLEHNLLVRTDGTLWSWGANFNGQLGDGTLAPRNAPVSIPGISGAWRVAAGAAHSLVLRADGTMLAWGANANGQLGDGTNSEHRTPAQVAGLTGIEALAAGYYHSLALHADGSVWAWGRNSNGQLGDGSTQDRNAPTRVSGLASVRAIAAGGFHSLALDSNGVLWTWGRNSDGQLGDGSQTDRFTPLSISGLSGVQALAAGGFHSLALEAGGTSWAWGDNTCGQLGDGTLVNRALPVRIEGLGGAQVLAGGTCHSLAVRADGTLWAWGNNLFGQLGDGTQRDRLRPQTVEVGSRSWAGAGDAHSLGVTFSPAVALRALDLDDGTLAGSSGNRDGRWNPGERVSLGIALRNVGHFPLSGLRATLALRSPDPLVTILQPSVTYGDLPAGGEAPGAQRYLLEIAAGTPAPRAVALTLTIIDLQGQLWVREVDLVVHPRAAAPNADFDGDRKADVLLRHPSSGNVYLWLMQ